MIKKIWVGAALALVLPVSVFAAEVRTGEQPSLAANERISDDFYIAGGNISSAGPVMGDLVAGGGSILITSAVAQDVIAGGGNISITGSVGDDVRAAGGNITISGPVKSDVVVGGGQTEISGPGVGGDILWGGGNIRIEAPVGKNLKLMGGTVYLNSSVKGNVEFSGQKLTLGPSAVIQGELIYTASEEATMETGATVKGATHFTKREMKGGVAKAGFAGASLVAFFVKFLMTLACALLLGLIFRTYSLRLVNSAVENPLLELGRGFAFLVITPIASIVLIITVIGLPLGVLGLLGFVALLIFGSILAPILLGSLVHKLTMKPAKYEVTWLTILIGALIYAIVGWIPFIGWIAKFALILIALGASVKIKWDVVRAWR